MGDTTFSKDGEARVQKMNGMITFVAVEPLSVSVVETQKFEAIEVTNKASACEGNDVSYHLRVFHRTILNVYTKARSHGKIRFHLGGNHPGRIQAHEGK